MSKMSKLAIAVVALSFVTFKNSYASDLVIGSRVWFSTGETEWSHCASVACGGSSGTVTLNSVAYTYQGGDPTSKLNYSDIDATIVEIFAKKLLGSGYRVSGTIGVGNGDGGTQRDQDWITVNGVTYEFSDSISTIRDTKVQHATIDFGYTFSRERLKITPFLGYVRYNEKLSAYGLTYLPNDLNLSYTAVANSTKVFDNEITWTGFRLGSEFEWQLSEKANVTINAAYVLNAEGKNDDGHVLRTSSNDLGPTPNIKIDGSGDGWMFDLLGSYNISKSTDVELGYRWWRFEADDGSTRFGTTFTPAYKTRTLFSERSGFLLGLKYRFN